MTLGLRTLELYENIEPRDAPVDPNRCAWAVWNRAKYPHQCSRKARIRIDGHGFCFPHARMIKP